MPDGEHFVREDVRGFLDMLKAMGGQGVEQVGAVTGREQMRALTTIAEADARELPVVRDLMCPGPAGDNRGGAPVTVGAPGALASERQEKGLNSGALGLISGTVVGAASTAPA